MIDTNEMLKNTLMVARIGEVLMKTKKEKNDWQMRMLVAGLGNRGLSKPEDWDTLSEDEKERRLKGALEVLKEVNI